MKYDDNDSDDARTLLLHNYDKLSRIFLIYFIILIFSRTTNCKSLKKINPCLFIPNITRNHVITYTTMLSSAGSDLRDIRGISTLNRISVHVHY